MTHMTLEDDEAKEEASEAYAEKSATRRIMRDTIRSRSQSAPQASELSLSSVQGSSGASSYSAHLDDLSPDEMEVGDAVSPEPDEEEPRLQVAKAKPRQVYRTSAPPPPPPMPAAAPAPIQTAQDSPVDLALENSAGDDYDKDNRASDALLSSGGSRATPSGQVARRKGNVGRLEAKREAQAPRSRAGLIDSPEGEGLSRGHRRGRQQNEHDQSPARQDSLERYLAQGEPQSFWPKQGYFENTYLGGDLSYHEALRGTSQAFQTLMERPKSFAWAPPLDTPVEEGLSLVSRLSHAHFDHPQRVILQIGIRGSDRYGWRRPALNLLIGVDPTLLHGEGVEERHAVLVDAVLPILRHLNPADQVGIALGDSVISPRSPDALKESLIDPLSGARFTRLDPQGWRALLEEGERVLNQASRDPHRAPGAQALLLLCADSCIQGASTLEQIAHKLNLDGTLTSVIDRSTPLVRHRGRSQLWKIASKGHGGYWPASDREGGLREAISREFERFSRVVARLIRLSVKLNDNVELIEILGSQMLSQKQAAQVKAREVAMDRRLSARLGIKSDRGEDDEGVQVVIPAFYGGDSHLIHFALWVKSPGELAEVNMKYKDLVRAQNASAASSVELSGRPAELTLAHREVRTGAEAHLVASQYLRAIDAGEQMIQLPAEIDLQQRLNIPQHLNAEERRLLGRSNLGRPLRR